LTGRILNGFKRNNYLRGLEALEYALGPDVPSAKLESMALGRVNQFDDLG